MSRITLRTKAERAHLFITWRPMIFSVPWNSRAYRVKAAAAAFDETKNSEFSRDISSDTKRLLFNKRFIFFLSLLFFSLSLSLSLFLSLRTRSLIHREKSVKIKRVSWERRSVIIHFNIAVPNTLCYSYVRPCRSRYGTTSNPAARFFKLSLKEVTL